MHERQSGVSATFGFLACQRDHEVVRELWSKIDEWVVRNHYLRGQTIDPHGRFLELPLADAWESLVLPEALKKQLHSNTIDMLNQSKRYESFGIPLKRGIILHGPPGTGKTMIGRALAQRWLGTFILVTPGSIEDAGTIRQIFRMARRLAPTLIFFENLDLIGPNRHRKGGTEILGEMLSALDGLETGEGIITVATTNDLVVIEPALKDRPSRFDMVLEIPPLGEPERRLFVERWLVNRRHELFPLDPLIDKTKGFTGAKMQEFCLSAMLEALKESDDPPMLKEYHWTKSLTVIQRAAGGTVGFGRAIEP